MLRDARSLVLSTKGRLGLVVEESKSRSEWSVDEAMYIALHQSCLRSLPSRTGIGLSL